MWFGQTSGEFRFTEHKKSLSEVFCRIGFDWSGATIFPRRSRKAILNDAELYDPTPLRQGDRVTFTGTGLTNKDVVCVFNKEIVPDELLETEEFVEAVETKQSSLSDRVNDSTSQSYFSRLEIALLIAGLMFALVVAATLYFLM